MLAIEASARIGGLGLRLCGRPRQRYYFLARHQEAPGVTAICYLGHDRGHALRQYERRVDNETAKRAIEETDCA